MSRQLAFAYPFSGYNSLTFTNCFASVYMHLEGIVGVDDYKCAKRAGRPCDGCGHCANSTARLQEDLYFLLDTLSGHASVRPDFAATSDRTHSSPDTIAFLMGLLGYGYQVLGDGLPGAVRDAIDGGTPVLARMRDESEGAFRVVVGYDGDRLIAADPAGAQGRPAAPTYAELAHVLCVSGKKPPAYGLADALRRIRAVMVANRDAEIWGQYMAQFRYWGGGLEKAEFGEIRRRFKRMCDISWFNFNCHNFAETFRHRVWEPLKDPRLDGVSRQIGQSYDNAHTRNWQLIGLHECRDWSTRRYHELEWGYCTCAVLCLEKLKQYDAEVLEAVEQAIAIVEGDTPPGAGTAGAPTSRPKRPDAPQARRTSARD